MKPKKEVKGNFVYEAEIGARSMIHSGDKFIWTSPVVDIRNVTEESVEIETINTIYKVILVSENESEVAA